MNKKIRRAISMAISFLFLLTLIVPISPATAADPPGLVSTAPSQPLAPDANILSIPTGGAITVDGSCITKTDEYANATVATFMDGNGKLATVYLIANADMLFICMHAQKGDWPTRFGRVYLDPQGDGSNYVFADQGDDAFQVNIPGQNRSNYIGNSYPNDWIQTPLSGVWTGQSSIGTDAMETVEYGLQLGALGFGSSCKVFGLSVFHHWFYNVGNDFGWPAGSIFDQPRTWQLARILSANCPSSDIAYIYRGNTADATSFYNLLTANSYGVDLIPLGSVLTTDFSVYNMIIIADDTGMLNDWGTPTFTDAQVDRIKIAHKPILGLGEGGYAFFGRLALYIGWPRGWHGPQNIISKASTAPPAVFFDPPTSPVTHYSAPSNSVGIYLPPNQSPPLDVTPIGMEVPPDDHSSLIAQGCRTLWGNSGNPQIFFPDGKLLFLKTVAAIHNSQCPNEPLPDAKCREVIKTAVPAGGTPVVPGQVIAYTLSYTYSSDKACNNSGDAKIVDSIPIDTTYVPGSASDGITPGGDGALTWSVVPDSIIGVRTKTFKVIVADTQCANQRTVNNRAGLLASGYAPVMSDVISHPVTCPPVGFPTTEPSYAEDELQVHPYPLVAGLASEVSVRLTNSGASAAAVTVQFQVNPTGIGIGLPYTTFDTRSITIPAHSQLILKSAYRPAASGLACFQVLVTAAGYTPIKTQTCIDNIEDFSGGGPNSLTFTVGNPTSFTSDVMLVVDNTCPGWSAAVITDPVGGILPAVGPNDSDLRSAILQVTPPSPAILGSGCHIDVQGWVTNPSTGLVEMIGGIRKLDVPPVHLPSNINPPWEEPEIVFIPTPPVAGSPGQLCIELNNPLGVEKKVTVQFSVADFGAGMGFTPIATQLFTLPPHTFARYCVPWTPSASGTLHRCILVVLKQAGYQDMHSQRNVDIVRTNPAGSGFKPFMTQVTIGNPDLVEHTLGFDMTTAGLDPFWVPKIVDGSGNPAPTTVLPGQALSLYLRLVPAVVGSAPQATNALFGDASQVSVGVQFDGVTISGFTVQFVVPKLFLPRITAP